MGLLGGTVASARSALATTLRRVSVIVGLVAGGIVFNVLKFAVLVVAWFSHLPTTGVLYWAVSLALLAASQATGGYVASRLSRTRGLAAAVAVGVVNLLLVVISLALTGWGGWAWWMTVTYLVLFVPSAAVGGQLGLRRRVESDEDDAQDAGSVDLAGS